MVSNYEIFDLTLEEALCASEQALRVSKQAFDYMSYLSEEGESNQKPDLNKLFFDIRALNALVHSKGVDYPSCEDGELAKEAVTEIFNDSCALINSLGRFIYETTVKRLNPTISRPSEVVRSGPAFEGKRLLTEAATVDDVLCFLNPDKEGELPAHISTEAVIQRLWQFLLSAALGCSLRGEEIPRAIQLTNDLLNDKELCQVQIALVKENADLFYRAVKEAKALS